MRPGGEKYKQYEKRKNLSRGEKGTRKKKLPHVLLPWKKSLIEIMYIQKSAWTRMEQKWYVIQAKKGTDRRNSKDGGLQNVSFHSFSCFFFLAPPHYVMFHIRSARYLYSLSWHFPLPKFFYDVVGSHSPETRNHKKSNDWSFFVHGENFY